MAEVLRHWLAGDDYQHKGAGFMGKTWDSFVPGPAVWREALRVLKPGGHMLAFFGSRTYDIGTLAIRLAGFEIRDQALWLYGSGFPKSLNVSKAIDGHMISGRSDSAALKIVNETRPGEATVRPSSQNGHRGIVGSGDVGPSLKRDTPATPEGEQWEGWGTALKPAHEPICVARKPLVGTVAANVLTHGTRAVNIDGCRVHSDDSTGYAYTVQHMAPGADQNKTGKTHQEGIAFEGRTKDGRWPANLIHDGSPEVVALFPAEAGQQAALKTRSSDKTRNTFGEFAGTTDANFAPHDERGSAARFFYCAKASRKDRNEGLASSDAPAVTTDATMRQCETADWLARNGNHHPTVKPTDLMAYLVRLVTPPGGLVLDPFMGSGSTGKAAMREGFRFVGIDMTPEYVDISRARIEHELVTVTAAREAAARAAAEDAAKPVQLSLLG